MNRDRPASGPSEDVSPGQTCLDSQRALRFIHILLHTHARPTGERLTKAALARLCGCSEKTIQRDVKRLKSDFGLHYDPARRTFVLPDGALPVAEMCLDNSNIRALGLAIGLLQTTGIPQQEKMLAALSRLTAGFSPSSQALLRETAATLAGGEMPRDYQNAPLLALASAVQRHQTLQIFYDSRRSQTRDWRNVDPYSIAPRAGVYWELHAWCHKRRAFLTFALNRIHGIQVAEAPFQTPFVRRETEWAQYQAQQGIGGLRGAAGAAPVAVDIRFDKAASAYAHDQPWPASLILTTDEDGAARLTGSISGGAPLTGLVCEVLRWRRLARVWGGPELLAAFRDEMAQIAAQYPP